MMIKVLSLHEPWASFMAWGYKRWETRRWATMYRGEIAIHAAKTDASLCDAKFLLSAAGVIESVFAPNPFPMSDDDWPLGKIVAVGRLVDCIPSLKANPTRQERELGNYSPGRAVWIFESIRRVRPLPFRGMQGLKPLPPETEARLEYVTEAA